MRKSKYFPYLFHACRGAADAARARSLLCGLALALFLVPAASRADGDGGPDCSTAVFEVTPNQGTQMTVLGTKYPETCALMVNGVRVELYDLATDAKHELSYDAIEAEMRKATGAGGKADTDLSLANIFSTFTFVILGRIPYTVHATPDHGGGYLMAPLDNRVSVVGTWRAPGPLAAEPLRGAVTLSLHHGGSLSFWGILWLKGAALLSLLWLLVPLGTAFLAAGFAKGLNTFLPVNTLPGMVLSFLVLPGLLAGAAYAIVGIWGTSTVPFFSSAIFAIAALLALLGALRFAFGKQKRFAAYFGETPPVFQHLTVHHDETEIGDIPIGSSYYARFILWFPHRQRCEKCDLNYIVHTASKVETPITPSEYAARDIGDKSTKLAQEAVQKSRTPVNGCPKCGAKNGAVAAADRALRGDAKVTFEMLGSLVGGFAVLFLGLALYVGYNAWNPEIPYVGPVVEEVLGYVFGFAIFIPLGFFLYGLYEVAMALSGKYLSRTAAFFRIWVCEAEGFLFEDAELVGDHSNCVSCKKDLEPLRSARATARLSGA